MKNETLSHFTHALLATALFRCWHIIIFFAGWSTLWTVIQLQGIRNISISPTLLTVIGTVLGFVISYRTSSSFERYNEGRKLWSQIVLASRTFARTTWFHIPDLLPKALPEDEDRSEDERKAKILAEKRSVIKLVEAFGVAVKHYLRGEEGVFYEDLYPLIKTLPNYALPNGMAALRTPDSTTAGHSGEASEKSTNERNRKLSLPHPATSPRERTGRASNATNNVMSPMSASFNLDGDVILYPARSPPKYHFFDIFPFSLLVKFLTERGRQLKGKKAARLRAQLQLGRHENGDDTLGHNIPLEITLYLSSYIYFAQTQGLDAATQNQLFNSLNSLVDALTGLERILTTPIPFSYSIHLWAVTWLYVIALPFQIVTALRWLTIPATVLASFIFFGFIVAGEEIENPFGYDKNDLNLDYFTHNIIRLELRAIMAAPPPNLSKWCSYNEAEQIPNARSQPIMSAPPPGRRATMKPT